ncbi:MAG: hypothetical protein J1F67_06615 [Muribaculaceae bacterium]|nr:hypothetical protein [Muribaculaceae bacterium]
MRNISLPLKIEKGKLDGEQSQKNAIDRHLDLLLSTPCYSSAVDPEFGFIFNNLKFEIFNEKDGVVYNSTDTAEIFEGKGGLYEKKISGSSKNLNTFASELKTSVNKYETRLQDVSVSMTYVRENRLIYINIKGQVKATGEDYNYTTTLKVWK